MQCNVQTYAHNICYMLYYVYILHCIRVCIIPISTAFSSISCFHVLALHVLRMRIPMYMRADVLYTYTREC